MPYALSIWLYCLMDKLALSKRNNFQFRCQPPIFSKVRVSVVNDPLRCRALKCEISVFLRRGTSEYVKSSTQQKGLYLMYFLVWNMDGVFWPILDLRKLKQSKKRSLFSHDTLSGHSPSCVDGSGLVYNHQPKGCVLPHISVACLLRNSEPVSHASI